MRTEGLKDLAETVEDTLQDMEGMVSNLILDHDEEDDWREVYNHFIDSLDKLQSFIGYLDDNDDRSTIANTYIEEEDTDYYSGKDIDE